MIGFSFPIRLIISGVMLEKTRNMIIKGSCTFAASTALPPNPNGTRFLTSCTIAGYAMNIVIPVAIAIMYEGMYDCIVNHHKSDIAVEKESDMQSSP
jgi:hypothetical protein